MNSWLAALSSATIGLVASALMLVFALKTVSWLISSGIGRPNEFTLGSSAHPSTIENRLATQNRAFHATSQPFPEVKALPVTIKERFRGDGVAVLRIDNGQVRVLAHNNPAFLC